MTSCGAGGRWRTRVLLIAALVLASAAQALTPSFARGEGVIQIGGGGTQRLKLGLNKSLVLDLPSDAYDILVANPAVADAVTRTARRIYLFGKQVGETNIFVFGAGGEQIASIDVAVERDVAGLEQYLKRFIPNSDIDVELINDNVVLTGTVETPLDASRAAQLATIFVTGGEATTGQYSQTAAAPTDGGGVDIDNPDFERRTSRIVNMLQIVGEDQVTLKVTVAEVSRSVMKQLGVNMIGSGSLDGISWGAIVDTPYGLGAPASASQLALGNADRDGPLQSLRPIPRISIQAFCETEAVAEPIRRAAEDRRMAKAHLKIRMGGIPAAVEFYQTATTPNLILLESRAESKELIAQLGSLAEVRDPTTKVVVIGTHNDVWLYRELIRTGISEYIVAPVSMADVVTVIANIFVDPNAEPLGRSIAFVGAKGGVGSSTLAHNLAWAMSSLFESEVVVADLDLPFGTANINFDQDPPQGIAEAVFAPERIDEVYLDRLLAQCADRLSLLAAPSTLDQVYDFDGEAFSAVIDTAQRTAPVVVLDVPHVWTGWARTTLMRADDIVITATPELANLRNTKNLVDTLKMLRPNDEAPKLIINQANVPKRPEIKPEDFAEPLGIVPLAVIPFEPQLFGTAANNGRMLGETDRNHSIVQTINEVAHVLAGRREVTPKKKSTLAALLRRLKK